ncbi:hypothetical protein ATK36_1689 [Amycolatopsis sulphurea]|uniref:Excreted virulence factor EspC (Type VII ESX diderm) n=1 Tax=Amycolatopsis sulphurea TaxID=76022 RepID=A0A2A9F5M6_9PSEU|nr:hypothetical protein [Amycolatopsis sulphurea]PFG46697.1 hypothetical protein ATK36_1689 [Amycolatopsis sulphurea]
MSGNGFTVHTDELHTFSRYLDGRTAPAVHDAAKSVDDANRGDVDSFGVLLAQLLAVPARITLKTVSDNLHGVADDVTKTAGSTKQAAERYAEQDAHFAAGLGKFDPEAAG